MVDYDKEIKAGTMPKAEIQEGAPYQETRSRAKSVVLRLPDSCFRGSSESDPGAGSRNTETMSSNCGVPLQVLESELSKAGLRVLSWSALMTVERSQHVPVHVAAQQLDADIVIIVNEIFAGTMDAGGEAGATFRYFSSDVNGTRGAPKELFDDDRNFFKEFVRARMGSDPKAAKVETTQAKLNATIVIAKPGDTGKTGESVWFYNWRIGVVAGASASRSFLFAGETFEGRMRWWPIRPLSIEAPTVVRGPVATSEEEFRSKIEVGPREAEVLYHKIASDFIRRFQGGNK